MAIVVAVPDIFTMPHQDHCVAATRAYDAGFTAGRKLATRWSDGFTPSLAAELAATTVRYIPDVVRDQAYGSYNSYAQHAGVNEYPYARHFADGFGNGIRHYLRSVA